MKRCIRPLIGKIPYDMLKKYGEIIAERMDEYANNTGILGILGGLFVGLGIGFLIGKFLF